MKRMALLALMLLSPSLDAQEYTRGVGRYPGDPRENFAPAMRIESAIYRNLALNRPAYHSSSYDYNLTAQLITDGIKDTKLPRWIAATTNEGPLAKHERERFLDDFWITSVNLKGPAAWVQFELAGGEDALEITRIEADARTLTKPEQPEEWGSALLGSADGKEWKELGRAWGVTRMGGDVLASFTLREPSRLRFYRITFDDPRALTWRIGEVKLFDKNAQVKVGGPYRFTSAWMSAGQKQEWVYVDLGAVCAIDRVSLYWVRRAAAGAIEISDDASAWKTVQPLPPSAGGVDEIALSPAVKARYVRVLMTKPATPEGYILSEMEVYGRGGPVAEPKPAPPLGADGRLDLAGGNWRIERDSLVKEDGPALSKPGFHDDRWLVATVPGTALASYVNAGALPDPDYGDNQLMISDSFFHADFWYRNEFVAPSAHAGKRVWLNFDGVNWKADVFLNGEKIGRIEGGFTRARFDVTSRVRVGQKNALAVRVEKNATPGSVKEKTIETPDANGGALGADNPTYHAAVGWDWIPTIRGRDTGLWNNVYLTATGPVTIDDPYVGSTLPLPDTSRADVTIRATLRNHDSKPVSGTLRGRFGEISFETPVVLEAASAKEVKLDPSTHPALRLNNPKLWWPAGYGEPNLYAVELRFETADVAVSEAKSFPAGVRQFTYSEEGGALRIWINGRRFIPRGGNWGFSESMLRYRAREYDAAVRYHREMNFNIIRNWVGQVGEDAFYEACDRHGIVVWQDFWLANSWDGPDPEDNALFLRNARDTVLRIRNHPSMGLYCGRNESFPPKPIDDGLKAIIAELDPAIHYIGDSADGVVAGHGPYGVQPPDYYFKQRAPELLHSELGMPNIVTMDSLRLMMPQADMWPQGRVWGLHDFCLNGAQRGGAFQKRIKDSYGGADNVADWVTLAQFVNYEGHRAMFEAQGKYRMGMLMWMSHPAWPSFVWQTYDYYLEPTAGYFGIKKASEPLHIQWNQATDMVEVVNYSAGNLAGLTARVRILNMDGTVKWEKTATLPSKEDSVSPCIQLEFPAGLTPVHFLKLELMRGGTVVSENFYWRGVEANNYRALRKLPKVNLEASTAVERQGDLWRLTTDLHNPSASPALMVRLKAVREKSGDRILPAIYSDNYISLMPGERRTIATELRHADTRGEAPRIAIEGFNAGAVAGKTR